MVQRAYNSPDVTPSQLIALHSRQLEALDSGMPRLKGTSVADFADKLVPPREWLVRGLIPARNATLLTGDGGTGKSLLGAQSAVAVILGRDFFGHAVTRAQRVIYLSAEDDADEMQRRFAAIARDQDIDLRRLEGLYLCCRPGKDDPVDEFALTDFLLATVDQHGMVQSTELFLEFRRFAKWYKPDLIIYDPLANLFGGNENSRQQVMQFTALLQGLATETKSTALLLAHPSVSGMSSGTGLSGSTAWSNAVRSRLYLRRVTDKSGVEADPDLRVLETMKANYAQKGNEISLRWHNGVFVSPDMVEVAAIAASREQVAEEIFLDLLQRYTATGDRVSPSRSPSYAPTVFAKDERGAAIGKDLFEKVMRRLLEAGRIKIVTEGSPKRQRQHLEFVR